MNFRVAYFFSYYEDVTVLQLGALLGCVGTSIIN